jgi:hypothetical protein
MALTRPLINNLNTTVEVFADPITVLHGGSTTANVDVGFIMNRANGLVSNVALYWNEAGNAFVTAFTSNSGGTDSNIAVTSYANIVTGSHTVYGAILPAANVTYDLGSPSQRFRTLYISGNTIDMGGALISSAPAGVTITHSSGSTFTLAATGSQPANSNATGAFGNVMVGSNLASTSTSTGALQVMGGAGITGAVYIGANANIAGTLVLNTITSALGTGANIIIDPDGAGDVVLPASTELYVQSTATATSSSTGALIVSGGTGIAGNLYVGGNLVVTGTQTFLNTETVNATEYVTTVIASTVNSATIGNIGANHVGTGTYLTSLNASNLSSGTVPSAQVSGSYTGITGVGTLTTGAIGTGFTAIPNSALANNSVTVAAGTGLSGGGTVALGGSITLNNTGVLSITGTANQITANVATGSILLSLPQSIATSSSPTFAGATLNGTLVATAINAGTIGNTGATLTGTLSTASQPNVTTLAGITSLGTAGVTTTAAGNFTVTGNLIVSGTTNTINNTVVETTVYTSTIDATTIRSATLGNIGANIVGTGTYLTSLNASNFSSGTVPLAQLSGITTSQFSATAGITNSQLANNSVTVSTGTGLSGGGTIALGGSITLTNAGVTSLTAGGNISISASTGGITVNGTNAGVTGAFAGTDITVSGATGGVTIGTNSTLATVTGRGATTGTALSLTNSTNATSPSTGALTISGGLGVGQDLWVGGSLYANTVISTTYTNLNVNNPLVYLAGNAYPYNYDIGMYSHFIGGPANVYAHTGFTRSYANGYWGLFSNVKSEPAGSVNWSDGGLVWDKIKTGDHIIANTTASTSTTTGALQVAGGAGIAGNVIIGGYGQFSGPFNESTTTAGVYVGIAGSGTPSPRYGFFNGNASQNWQIDNYGGTFRWFTPGVTRMTLDGNTSQLNVSGNIVTSGGIYTTTGLFWAGNNNVISTGGGGGGVVGLNGQIQYNNGGVAGASSLYYFSSNTALGTTSNITAGGILTNNYYYANGAPLSSTFNLSGGSGSGSVTGGGTLTLSGSTGLTTSVSGSTFTLTNSGVTSAVAGTGVSVSGATGAVTVSIGQSVATSATPTFAGGSFTGNVARNSKPLVTNYTGSTAPSSPIQGDTWYNSSTDVIYQYVFDGTNNVWVDTAGLAINGNTNIAGSTLNISGTAATGSLTVTGTLSVSSSATVTGTLTTGGLSVSTLTGFTATGSILPGSTATYNLGSSSYTWATIYGKSTSATYADLAEVYSADTEYLPGTVVVFGGTAEVTTTMESHDPRVAGVISTNPAHLMNAEADGVAVALTGRVPCFVKGPVRKGDRLVTSDIPGVAEVLNKDRFEIGCVIGKSLCDYENNDITTIEIAVGRY